VGTERLQGDVTQKGGERGGLHAPAPEIPPGGQPALLPFGRKNARPRIPCSRLLAASTAVYVPLRLCLRPNVVVAPEGAE
jgi:hypothetical protein